MRLLTDWDRCLWACDISGNKAFHKADARSRGYGGKRVVDAFQERTREEWAEKLMATVRLPIANFVAEVPKLLVKTINEPGSRVPWGPWTDPFYQEDEDTNLYGLVASGKARRVVVPCPWRRMLDNLFEGILVDTADHHLHVAARAYRRGKRDTVRAVIREIQRAVRNGEADYWARLDIKDFFPSMPWVQLREALVKLGYLVEFVAMVMALVQAPLVDNEGVPVANTAGSQAGVRVSGVLANILLLELDDVITKKFKGRIRYWRYSDDLIITSKERQHVLAAARVVNAWCSKAGLKVKGVSA